ncbi:MAG TPA: FxLYD domain-containing protein, partial [Thermoanaerobaculia bacterium]|nr:FxLYD domain-containing protein [Thermoanaerobaculia bacterium]
MSRRNTLGLLAVLLMAAAPAQADWLVTRDGGRVETKGIWKVKGKLVVFTQADGALSSLRLSEVDLEASRKATEDSKVKAEKPPAPEPPKKKLAVLTDADFKKATPQGSTAPPKAEEGQAAPPGLVSVSSWKRADQGDGLQIEGTLHNNTEDMVVNAAVEVQLYNEAGDRVGTAPALLT